MAKTNPKAATATPIDDYQVQDDLRTLHKAHQIKKDPKRHAAALNLVKQQLAAAQQPVQVPPPDDATQTPVD